MNYLNLWKEALIKEDDRLGKQITWPPTIRESLDVLFSHNSVIGIWGEIKDEDGNYLKELWHGMAWDCPDIIIDLRINRFFGCIPERHIDADRINFIIDIPNITSIDDLKSEIKEFQEKKINQLRKGLADAKISEQVTE